MMPQPTEPAITPTTRAIGQDFHVADPTIATTIDSHNSDATTNTRMDHEVAVASPETAPEEQDPVLEEAMAKADNVPRVSHQGT
jgi:hypothetical protein